MTRDALQAARDIYNIARWGEGYFDINDQGQVVAYPTRNPADGQDRKSVV